MSSRGRYPLAVAIALLGLGPNVVLSTAFLPLEPAMGEALGTSQDGLSLALGLGSAAYAAGAVFAVQLALRIVQRRFVLASCLAAVATGPVVFTVGHVLQGLAAGAMLITSLPPLITRFGAAKVGLSAAIVNVGIFGASTLGPIVGGLAAAGQGWRWLLVAAAVLGTIGWVVALVGYERWAPGDPELPVDTAALVLVVIATVATFFATSLVSGRAITQWQVWAPFALGILALVGLLVVESRKDDPLIPVEALSTQLPVTGILVAMIGGAIVVTVTELLQVQLGQMGGRSPAAVARVFWPMPVGAALGAIAFWLLFRTRWVPVLIDVGLAALAGGSALLLAGSQDSVVLPATFVLGLGAAATVSPGLFLTGFGIPSTQLARAFGLVQLLRSVATYAVAPVVLGLALQSASPAAGLRAGLVAMAVLAAAGLLAAVVVPAVSGARLRGPDIEAWLEGDKGLPSPATATHLRPGVEDEDAAPLLPHRK
jgi:MFS family permease